MYINSSSHIFCSPRSSCSILTENWLNNKDRQAEVFSFNIVKKANADIRSPESRNRRRRQPWLLWEFSVIDVWVVATIDIVGPTVPFSNFKVSCLEEEWLSRAILLNVKLTPLEFWCWPRDILTIWWEFFCATPPGFSWFISGLLLEADASKSWKVFSLELSQ